MACPLPPVRGRLAVSSAVKRNLNTPPLPFTSPRHVSCGFEAYPIPPQVVPGQLQPCIFEYIYLARPDSVMNNISVYNFQLELGTCLAKRIE